MIYACLRLHRKYPDLIVMLAGFALASTPWAVWLPTRSRWVPSGYYALMRGFSEEIDAACGIIFCLGCAVALTGAVRMIRRFLRRIFTPSVMEFCRALLSRHFDPTLSESIND
jgi:hypothetical protein